MKIEKSEMKNQERNRGRKFSRGGSSSCKRTRESQVDSVRGSTTKDRRQGPDERPECPHYHKHYVGICRRVTWGCFRCGSTNHLIANCPQGSRISRNPQGSGRGGSNVPPLMSDRGRGRGSLG